MANLSSFTILGKSSDGMKKINDVENDGYQRRNVASDGTQTSCDITQRCKLKIKQIDNGNSVAENSEVIHLQHLITTNRNRHQLLLTNLLF